MENDNHTAKYVEICRLLQIIQELTDNEVRHVITYAESLKTQHTHEPS